VGNIPRARVFFMEVSIYDVKLTLQYHMKINSYTILYLLKSTAYLLGVAEKLSRASGGGGGGGGAYKRKFTVYRYSN